MRGTILDTAKEIINGARQDAYGNPEDCFSSIAALWNWYLSSREKKLVGASDVAMMMVLLKVAREASCHKADNVVDACGYLALYQDMVDAPLRVAGLYEDSGSENLPTKAVSEDLPGVRAGNVGMERVGWEDVTEDDMDAFARALESRNPHVGTGVK